MATLEQWRATWQALGVAPPGDQLFRQVLDRYTEPQRAYHDTSHLDDCLALLPSLRSEALHPAEVELALWFHDAVYDPRAPDNEHRSAEWARSASLEAGLPPEVAERIAALVLATRHDAAPDGADARVIADVDLAILAADPERFDQYERQIRQEYAWVPAPVFRRERRRILEGFLARTRIFHTGHLAAREAAARENLRRSIRRLEE